MSAETEYRQTVIPVENSNVGGKTIAEFSPYEDTSYLLEGTGFPIEAETDVLERLLFENIGKEPYLSIIKKWEKMTEQNFFHFTQEHMRKRPLLGFLYAPGNSTGVTRLEAPRYGNAVIADISGFQERQGSQKMAISGNPQTGDEGFEAFFLRAPVGSIVARTSPPGPSGYPGYTYKEAQTQFMLKVEENGQTKIKGFNIRTMTSVDQSEQLLLNLGVPEHKIRIHWAKGQEYDRLSNVTGINVYFPADSNLTTIENLFEEWHNIFGNAIFNQEEYSVENMRNDLQRFDELINLDTEVVERIEKIKEYVTDELMRVCEEVMITRQIPKEALTNLQKVYGTMVLDFWMKIKHGSQPVRVDDINVSTHSYSDNVVVGYGGDRYRKALTELQSSTGCPGVQSKKGNQTPGMEFLENPYGGIYAEYDPIEATLEISIPCKAIECPQCGWKPTKEQEKEIGKSIKKCPTKGCGWAPGQPVRKLIDITAKQDKMTIFQSEENNPTKKEIIKKEVIRESEKINNEKKFSVTIFWGSSVRLKKVDED